MKVITNKDRPLQYIAYNEMSTLYFERAKTTPIEMSIQTEGVPLVEVQVEPDPPHDTPPSEWEEADMEFLEWEMFTLSRETIKELEMETFDLIAKIVGILVEHDLWNDDSTYTFKDGDRWARFEPAKELEYLTYTKEENECYE